MKSHRPSSFIRAVTVVGANGTMGTRISALIADLGQTPVYLVARTKSKAIAAKQIADRLVHAEKNRIFLIPKTYKDLRVCFRKSDWIIEFVSENYTTKLEINSLIARYKKPKCIVSTGSSGLSINRLSQIFSDTEKRYYFGTHFFNPPDRMHLCEFVCGEKSDKNTAARFETYLTQVLKRTVVRVFDSPGYAANRIGFQLLNEMATFAEIYGVAYMDFVFGPHTGRLLPPLATIDFVGLDVHKAICDHLYAATNDDAHPSFMLPQFIQSLIMKGNLGRKTGSGLYKKVGDVRLVYNVKKFSYEPIPIFSSPMIDIMKHLIAKGKYSQAMKQILTQKSDEATLLRYFFSRYISFAYGLIGATAHSNKDIDRIMVYGFHWIPPGALIDLLGKKNVLSLLKLHHFPIPTVLSKQTPKKFYTMEKEFPIRNFFSTKVN